MMVEASSDESFSERYSVEKVLPSSGSSTTMMLCAILLDKEGKESLEVVVWREAAEMSQGLSGLCMIG
ncbi:hypothetical protein VNO77_41817 [Canavalia gladiata]|uniref:Uncharacterized protein n=1 Tax=Canavalia gladiata TaxID=3824 RepID=A0AAN9JZX2_CANGL